MGSRFVLGCCCMTSWHCSKHPVGRIEIGAGHGVLEVAQEAPDVGASARSWRAASRRLASNWRMWLAILLSCWRSARCMRNCRLARRLVIHSWQSLAGRNCCAHALHQRGQVGGVLAQRHQRFIAHLGIIAVAQVGGAGALLAFGGGGAVRLPPVAPVRLQILLSHRLLDECHIELLRVRDSGHGIRDKGYGTR